MELEISCVTIPCKAPAALESRIDARTFERSEHFCFIMYSFYKRYSSQIVLSIVKLLRIRRIVKMEIAVISETVITSVLSIFQGQSCFPPAPRSDVF